MGTCPTNPPSPNDPQVKNQRLTPYSSRFCPQVPLSQDFGGNALDLKPPSPLEPGFWQRPQKKLLFEHFNPEARTRPRDPSPPRCKMSKQSLTGNLPVSKGSLPWQH